MIDSDLTLIGQSYIRILILDHIKLSWKSSSKPVCGLLDTKSGFHCFSVADRDKATKTVRLCTYCQKPGHYRKNCPELKKDVETLQQQKMKLANGEPKLPAVGGIKGAVNAAIVVQPPVPMPVRVSTSFLICAHVG